MKTAKEKIFFDTDVILDISTGREPFFADSAKLLSLVEKGEYKGFASSLSFSNIYYIHRKFTDHTVAVNFLKKLRLLVTVLNVNDAVIQKALESGFKDFEDAVQYYACLQNKIDFIITRNIDDYKKSDISVYTPSEFLALKMI